MCVATELSSLASGGRQAIVTYRYRRQTDASHSVAVSFQLIPALDARQDAAGPRHGEVVPETDERIALGVVVLRQLLGCPSNEVRLSGGPSPASHTTPD